MQEEEVTLWIRRLAQGDPSAVQHIWDRYYERLVQLARRKLGDSSRRMADEEDVVLSAFHSFCRGAAAGRFPRLDDSHDLWKILLTITVRKAAAQIKHGRRQKRGGGTVRGESIFRRPDDAGRGFGIDQVLGGEPTPASAALVTEQFQRLLSCLEDDVLRQIALDKLEGYSNEEIAERLDCAPRTVERKLARIRHLWSQQAELTGEPR